MNGMMYQDILEDHLISFQQGKNPKHTVKMTQKCLAWSSQILDFNRTGTVWRIRKGVEASAP